MRLGRLGRTFDCALDAGSFHRVELGAARRLWRALARVVHEGGRLFLLCFGDHERGRGGPRRVTRSELAMVGGAKGSAWTPWSRALIEGRGYPGGANAWLLKATRL